MIKLLQKMGLILLAGLSFGVSNVTGQILYEPFNGTGALNGSALAGTSGWADHSGTAGQIMKEAGSLTYPVLAAPSGNKIVITSTNSEDINLTWPGAVTEGAIYSSFLMKVLNTTSLQAPTTTVASTGAVLTNFGGYFYMFGGAAGAQQWVSRVSIKAGTAPNTFQLGVWNNSSQPTGTGEDVYGPNPVNYAVGETYLIVVKYEFSNTGTNTTNKSTLWVNPALGSGEPATSTVTNMLGTPATTISSIVIREATSTGNTEIDEIRVGRTWESVTPGPLGIASFKEGGMSIYPNPTAGDINLKLPTGFGVKNKVNLMVYTATGEVLLKATGSEGALNEQLNQQLGAATPGMYLVKIDDGVNSYQSRIVRY